MSVFRAGFLGAGLALVLREKLGVFVVPILVGGLVAHTLGMYLKHKWEEGLGPLPQWVNALYWACCVLLAILTVFVIVR